MATSPRSTTARRGANTDASESNGRVTVSSREIPLEGTDVRSRLGALSPFHLLNRIPGVEGFLKREEADVILIVGNVALVAFEIIEWPVAALTLAVHALHRSRFKALEVIVEIAEEAE
jgi:hypothetical protein